MQRSLSSSSIHLCLVQGCPHYSCNAYAHIILTLQWFFYYYLLHIWLYSVHAVDLRQQSSFIQSSSMLIFLQITHLVIMSSFLSQWNASNLFWLVPKCFFLYSSDNQFWEGPFYTPVNLLHVQMMGMYTIPSPQPSHSMVPPFHYMFQCPKFPPCYCLMN